MEIADNNLSQRSFWPGDDPYLEAVDLHYFMTGDLEWYDRDRVYTKDGNLVIEVVAADPDNNHNLQFQSGMVSSWNKVSGPIESAWYALNWLHSCV